MQVGAEVREATLEARLERHPAGREAMRLRALAAGQATMGRVLREQVAMPSLSLPPLARNPLPPPLHEPLLPLPLLLTPCP